MRSSTSILRLLALTVCCAVVFGCASGKKRPTQADFDTVNEMCYAHANADKRINHPQWFTRWVGCKQEHVMPMEMVVYLGKEAEIRAMYSKLLELGKAVDEGRSKVEPVYDEYDRMEAGIRMYKGICYHHADGTQRCIDPSAKQSKSLFDK
jgi:hypothetical protein